jgi:bacterioferritin-associated ferredoxin
MTTSRAGSDCGACRDLLEALVEPEQLRLELERVAVTAQQIKEEDT